MSIRKPSVIDLNNINHTPNYASSTSYGIEVKNIIPTPSWVTETDGFEVNCHSTIYDDVIRVHYSNKSVQTMEYDIFYAVNPDGMVKFPNNEGIWKHINDGAWDSPAGQNFRIGDTGIVYYDDSEFGGDGDIATQIHECHKRWKHFPDIKNWDDVYSLYEARCKINELNNELMNKNLERKISYCLELIDSLKNDVANLEKQKNHLYESAANAMNIYEEHGLKPKIYDENNPDESLDGEFKSLIPTRYVNPKTGDIFVKDSGYEYSPIIPYIKPNSNYGTTDIGNYAP